MPVAAQAVEGKLMLPRVVAAVMLRLTTKNLERQEGQHEIGAASDRDLDQAPSDHA